MQHTLNINGKTVSATSQETLVDAALTAGILIPHDCATGQCETCRVRIPWGNVDDAGTAYGDTVLACQAKVAGDATLTFETAPIVGKTNGFVEELNELSNDVLELVIRVKEPMRYRPGQYAKLTLDGYPAREYSYSARMDGTEAPDQLVFQIKRLKSGEISSALGNSIRIGHKAQISGPFGSAFLRVQETGPLVLTCSGTGFAPIWSLARAVTLANDNRPLTIIAGIRTPQDLYMENALGWLKDHKRDQFTIVSRANPDGLFKHGTPDMHLPDLNDDTSVHVAGGPELVERVREKALLAQARCYSDPFTPSANVLGWSGRVKRLFSPKRMPKRVPA